jgi:hypothetical protein
MTMRICAFLLAIAGMELMAALLLLSPYAAFGSVIAVADICGAIMAHVTRFGLVVNDDGGRLVGMLVTVLLCAVYVMISPRKETPLVGVCISPRPHAR